MKFQIYRIILEYFFTLSEKIRFLFAGGVNTLFGFGTFAILYLLLGEFFHYLVILIISNFIAVVFSFLTLKFLVFQTKRNFLQEFIKCYTTYLVILFLNSVLLYFAVDIAKQPIILSQLFITISLVIISYIAHKYFTFKTI
jgi:putative flippase GtrA